MIWPWQQFDVLQRLIVLHSQQLAQINSKLDTLIAREASEMASMDDIKAAVVNETTVIGSVTTLLTQLSQQLSDALKNEDPAEAQAVLDEVNANIKALSDAVAANTPQPPPAPAPTV